MSILNFGLLHLNHYNNYYNDLDKKSTEVLSLQGKDSVASYFEIGKIVTISGTYRKINTNWDIFNSFPIPAYCTTEEGNIIGKSYNSDKSYEELLYINSRGILQVHEIDTNKTMYFNISYIAR